MLLMQYILYLNNLIVTSSGKFVFTPVFKINNNVERGMGHIVINWSSGAL